MLFVVVIAISTNWPAIPLPEVGQPSYLIAG